MKRVVFFLLAACLLVCMLPQVASARRQNYDPTVKIGLYYDSAALPAANLQNVTGMDEGYEFGYYDEDREFISTYEVYDENRITVLKNTNMWLSDTTYSDMELAYYDDVVGADCTGRDRRDRG